MLLHKRNFIRSSIKRPPFSTHNATLHVLCGSPKYLGWVYYSKIVHDSKTKNLLILIFYPKLFGFSLWSFPSVPLPLTETLRNKCSLLVIFLQILLTHHIQIADSMIPLFGVFLVARYTKSLTFCLLKSLHALWIEAIVWRMIKVWQMIFFLLCVYTTCMYAADCWRQTLLSCTPNACGTNFTLPPASSSTQLFTYI